MINQELCETCFPLREAMKEALANVLDVYRLDLPLPKSGPSRPVAQPFPALASPELKVKSQPIEVHSS